MVRCTPTGLGDLGDGVLPPAIRVGRFVYAADRAGLPGGQLGLAAAGPGGGQARAGAFDEQLALELVDRAEDIEDTTRSPATLRAIRRRPPVRPVRVFRRLGVPIVTGTPSTARARSAVPAAARYCWAGVFTEGMRPVSSPRWICARRIAASCRYSGSGMSRPEVPTPDLRNSAVRVSSAVFPAAL